jgi:Spy/CpxP family protein refolding chaperone
MKLNKTITLVALVAGSLLAGTALQAQDAPKEKPPGQQGGPGMRGRPNIDQIAKELNLTEDQKTSLKAAMEEQQAKMKALREDQNLSQEDRRAKAKEIREAHQAKIKEILTPEQLEKWQKRAQQNRPPQAGGDKPGDKPGDKAGDKPGKAPKKD